MDRYDQKLFPKLVQGCVFIYLLLFVVNNTAITNCQVYSRRVYTQSVHRGDIECINILLTSAVFGPEIQVLIYTVHEWIFKFVVVGLQMYLLSYYCYPTDMNIP